ncbi:MAG: M14 family metallopeptidase, partial [Acidobacteriota bacterium]
MKRKGIFIVGLIVLISVPLSAGIGFAVPENAEITFDKYHRYDEMTAILKDLAQNHKDICRLYSIGKSLKGKDIWLMEITNYRTGDATAKPAIYCDGNIHAGEVTGAETALHNIYFLLSQYGEDKMVTHLVDHFTFYIVPRLNPDGSELYLGTPLSLRSSVRPYDNDQDGKLDEDPPNDLNDDGVLSQMRIKDPDGAWVTSPKDSRLMVRRKEGEPGEWRLLRSEGIDDDGDGRLNEDGPGGLDINRNYPARWQLAHKQRGGGRYPLSEPETRAEVDFIFDNPNIAMTEAYHTAAGVILRPFCNQPDSEFPPEDKRLYDAIGNKGTSITGYSYGSVYEDFTSNKAYPRWGVFVDWGYLHYGVTSFSTELWGSQYAGKDYNEDGKITEEERLRWSDEELDGAGFIPWKSFKHPQYGEIEIGGWQYKFISQNPPPKYLLQEVQKNTYFFLYRASELPLMRIDQMKVTPIEGGVFKVEATVANKGGIPTALQMAEAIKINQPDRVILSSSNNVVLLSGKKTTEIGNLKGQLHKAALPSQRMMMFMAVGEAEDPTAKSLQWIIHLKNGKEGWIKLTVLSEKGGTNSYTIKLRKGMKETSY